MNKEVLYPSLYVHAETIALALAEAGRDGEVRNYGMIPSDLHAVEKRVRKLGQPGKELRACYEAGSCGFVLVRRLQALGYRLCGGRAFCHSEVIGRQDQDGLRDARMLARLHRTGGLTTVHVPDQRDEAIRNLCRARTDATQIENGVRLPLSRKLQGNFPVQYRTLDRALCT